MWLMYKIESLNTETTIIVQQEKKNTRLIKIFLWFYNDLCKLLNILTIIETHRVVEDEKD
jgi:hypothetical protein